MGGSISQRDLLGTALKSTKSLLSSPGSSEALRRLFTPAGAGILRWPTAAGIFRRWAERLRGGHRAIDWAITETRGVAHSPGSGRRHRPENQPLGNGGTLNTGCWGTFLFPTYIAPAERLR